MFQRFLAGLGAFSRQKISLKEARSIILRRLDRREENFLVLMRHGVYDNLASPYLPLLRMADCQMADISSMVRQKGLETALEALRNAGVYLSFEEFKGRKPVIRNGKKIPLHDKSFDNPNLSRFYPATTGGRTGKPKKVYIDLKHLQAQAPSMMLGRGAHNLLGMPSAIWLGLFPDGSGPNNLLRPSCFGDMPKKWFAPLGWRLFKNSPEYGLANLLFLFMGRVHGLPIPIPRTVSFDQAPLIARWMKNVIEKNGACLLNTHPSKALRVAFAAREEGFDLRGGVFLIAGEPITKTKAAKIEETGARWVPYYPFTEMGHVGFGCANPVEENDIHLYRDSVALIQARRRVEENSGDIDAFYFTSLLPSAPKLLLNVQSDDSGLLEKRRCGCQLDELGYCDHLRRIGSFGKMVSESVTLMRSDLVKIIEEILPGSFGGSSLDYQFQEEEDEEGFTRLNLLISQNVSIPDERKVIETVMNSLGDYPSAAGQARAIWSKAEAVRIRRVAPEFTARGKLLPLLSKQYSPKNSGSHHLL